MIFILFRQGGGPTGLFMGDPRNPILRWLMLTVVAAMTVPVDSGEGAGPCE